MIDPRQIEISGDLQPGVLLRDPDLVILHPVGCPLRRALAGAWRRHLIAVIGRLALPQKADAFVEDSDELHRQPLGKALLLHQLRDALGRLGSLVPPAPRINDKELWPPHRFEPSFMPLRT